jgi:acylphosphatase
MILSLTSPLDFLSPQIQIPGIFILFEAAHGDYAKFAERSNTFLQKSRKKIRAPKNIASGVRLWLHPAVPEQPPAMTATRQRLKIFYSGRVQGVGFRYAVKNVAAGFEITGTVRNLSDGRVELTAESRRGELEAFRAAISGSELAGFIRDENIFWDDAQNEFRGFEIVR